MGQAGLLTLMLMPMAYGNLSRLANRTPEKPANSAGGEGRNRPRTANEQRQNAQCLRGFQPLSSSRLPPASTPGLLTILLTHFRPRKGSQEDTPHACIGEAPPSGPMSQAVPIPDGTHGAHVATAWGPEARSWGFHGLHWSLRCRAASVGLAGQGSAPRGHADSALAPGR